MGGWCCSMGQKYGVLDKIYTVFHLSIWTLNFTTLVLCGTLYDCITLYCSEPFIISFQYIDMT